MVAGLFLYMLTLNQLMPMHRDDYEYALIWGTFDKIDSWKDVFQSLYNHYMTHGGRMVDFFVLDSFMLLGKEWFNPFNAFLYVVLMILVYWYSKQEITFKFNPYFLGLIMVFCWLGLPHFALTNIWMTGACVYLMPAVFILSFLLPYYFQLIGKSLMKNGFPQMLGMFLAGLISAWTIENTAATMTFAVGISTIYFYRKGILKNWMISGLIGNLLGLFLLIAAPGNYVRYASQSSKLIYHFTNQFAGTGEMLLYVFPILFFFLILYRSLKILHWQEKGRAIQVPPPIQTNWDPTSIWIIGMIFLVLASYLSSGFFWKGLASGMYNHIAVPLGIATPKLRAQFFNTMSGLEEMLIYLLTVGQMYRYAFRKLRLRAQDHKTVFKEVSFKELLQAYPACRYTVLFFALCILNNLAMVASPTFPGRATYSSALFLLIGTMTLFNISLLYERFFSTSRKIFMAAFAGIVFIPMAVAVLWQYTILDAENARRIDYIKTQAKQGAEIVVLDPISLKSNVLRHVYYVELNNPVSKYGLCRYYGIKDIVVKGK